MKKIFIYVLLSLPMIAGASENISSGYYVLNVGNYNTVEKQHPLPKYSKESIQIKKNDIFSISLPANPTTGYSWALKTLPNVIVLLDTNYQQSEECTKSEMLGCGGFTTYTFKTISRGKGEINFVYAQQWMNDNNEMKTIRIVVN